MQHNLLGVMDDEKIRLREEVQEQIRALSELKEMAVQYGDDISKPATNSREAVQVRIRVRTGLADTAFMCTCYLSATPLQSRACLRLVPTCQQSYCNAKHACKSCTLGCSY